MRSSPSSPDTPISLPPLVAAFVEATNSFDLDRLLTTFADDALVNDQLRDYWGKTSDKRCRTVHRGSPWNFLTWPCLRFSLRRKRGSPGRELS
jgi:hypothetical protein